MVFSTINIKNKNFIFGNVEAIKVIGLEHHLNKSIKENLKYLNDKEILSINKEELSKKISNYDYIENFKVSKLYPDNLIFNLRQTTFLASTFKQNKKYLIGSNAKLIDYDIFSNYNNLPTIYGNFEPEDFILLKNKIENSPLEFNNIKNFFFYPSFRWDIENKDNITIKLPYKNIDEALIQAKKIIDSNNLIGDTIDLRIKNQVILSNE